jgi:hypothetical protein
MRFRAPVATLQIRLQDRAGFPLRGAALGSAWFGDHEFVQQHQCREHDHLGAQQRLGDAQGAQVLRDLGRDSREGEFAALIIELGASRHTSARTPCIDRESYAAIRARVETVLYKDHAVAYQSLTTRNGLAGHPNRQMHEVREHGGRASKSADP